MIPTTCPDENLTTAFIIRQIEDYAKGLGLALWQTLPTPSPPPANHPDHSSTNQREHWIATLALTALCYRQPAALASSGFFFLRCGEFMLPDRATFIITEV